MMPLKVELDVFSGRPNPMWELGEREKEELELMIQRALPTQERRILPALGYRGFILYESEILRVYHGQIIPVPTEQQKVAMASTELEGWLLDTGKKHLETGVYDAVRDVLR